MNHAELKEAFQKEFPDHPTFFVFHKFKRPPKNPVQIYFDPQGSRGVYYQSKGGLVYLSSLTQDRSFDVLGHNFPWSTSQQRMWIVALIRLGLFNPRALEWIDQHYWQVENKWKRQERWDNHVIRLAGFGVKLTQAQIKKGKKYVEGRRKKI